MNLADAVAIFLAIGLVAVCWVRGTQLGGATGAGALLIAVGSHLALASASAMGLFAAAPDSLAFHQQAIEFTNGWRELAISGPSSLLWSYGLSVVYMPFGPSVLLGYVVNLWIYLAAMLQLVHFADEIGVGRHRWKIVLIFSLLPASLLFCNFLLRESLQIFLLIFAIRHLDRYRRRGALSSLLVAALAFVPFGAIHSGFFLYPPIALAGAVIARTVLAPRVDGGLPRPALGLSSVLAGLVIVSLAVAIVGSFNESRRLTQLVEGDIDVGESIAAAGERGARTALPWRPPPDIVGTAVFSPILLGQFLFAPIVPFAITEPQDLVAAADTALRAVFLLAAVRFYLRGTPDQKRMALFLLGSYFVFCLLAAVGTTTVGTALRHHLKVFWIIIALGAPVLFERSPLRRRALVPA
jgi:hypothetical protein